LSEQFFKAIDVQERMSNFFHGKTAVNKKKISETQREKIRKLFQEGMKESHIAHHMNLEVMTVLNNVRMFKGRADRSTKFE
jgi:DNA-binding NarL/FixJ family response regulator